AAAAAVAASVLLVSVGAAAGWFAGTPAPKASHRAEPSASADQPLLAVQQHTDAQHGITVNVPAGWTKSAAGTYIDYTDPADKNRKVRINVEKAGGSARQFFAVAESNLKKSTTCTAPYARVDLRDVELDGRAAGELEYTCGQGDQMRHGI